MEIRNLGLMRFHRRGARLESHKTRTSEPVHLDTVPKCINGEKCKPADLLATECISEIVIKPTIKQYNRLHYPDAMPFLTQLKPSYVQLQIIRQLTKHIITCI